MKVTYFNSAKLQDKEEQKNNIVIIKWNWHRFQSSIIVQYCHLPGVDGSIIQIAMWLNWQLSSAAC